MSGPKAGLDEVSWAQYREALRVRARERGVPATGTFELTPLCNLRCRMCYVRLTPEKVDELGGLRSAEEWLDLARQAQELGTYRLTLTGGEVLTRPDFPRILEGLAGRGMLINILSNATLIDEGVVSLLERCRPTGMRFTLYGTSNETYERLCGDPSGFDRVMRTLRLLSSTDLPYSLAFTETTENIGELEEARRVADSLSVGLSVATALVPAVRGAESEANELRVPLEDRPDFVAFEPGVEDCAAMADGATRGPEDAFAMCGPYRSGFYVDWNGDMEACSYMHWCRCRPFERGFAAAWEEMLGKLARVRLPKRCLECGLARLCSACPGMREAETGRPDGIPERMCANAAAWRRRLSEAEERVSVTTERKRL